MLRRSAPVGASILVAAGLLVASGGTIATAAPGNPGVPSDPTAVFIESFEHELAEVGSVLLTDYEGADGTTYGGTPYWTEPTMCNGIIIRNAAAAPAGCGGAAANQIRQMASALGLVNGTAVATDNHAVSAYTNAPTVDFPLAADDIEFQTTVPISIPAGSRFLTFSVNAASINCGVSAALLSFSLVDDGTEYPATNSAINVCTDAAAEDHVVNGTTYSAGTFTSDSSVLFGGTELDIVMRNGNDSGVGNDHAYDDIVVLDATPQLDKSFEQPEQPATEWALEETAELTFFVTNTSELAEKDGWGFVDTLPEGLVLADVTPSHTCGAASIVAEPGTGEIEVTGGRLDTGMTVCEITVEVEAPGGGVFENGPDNLVTTGLNPPLPTEVTFEGPPPALPATGANPVAASLAALVLLLAGSGAWLLRRRENT